MSKFESKVTYMSPISNDHFKDYMEAENRLSQLEEVLTDRIGYIIDKLHDICGINYEYWYFEGAPEGDVGKPDIDQYTVSSLVVDYGCNGYKSIKLILKDGEEWILEESFPSRWLFEDFEQEVIDGKKKFDAKEKARKEKAKQQRLSRKEKDKRIIEKVTSKLTKEEIAAIKRS